METVDNFLQPRFLFIQMDCEGPLSYSQIQKMAGMFFFLCPHILLPLQFFLTGGHQFSRPCPQSQGNGVSLANFVKTAEVTDINVYCLPDIISGLRRMPLERTNQPIRPCRLISIKRQSETFYLAIQFYLSYIEKYRFLKKKN